MSRDQYYKNIRTLAKCQASYDAMVPDDDDNECPDCGAEIMQDGDGWVCSETCGWSVSPDYE